MISLSKIAKLHDIDMKDIEQITLYKKTQFNKLMKKIYDDIIGDIDLDMYEYSHGYITLKNDKVIEIDPLVNDLNWRQ